MDIKIVKYTNIFSKYKTIILSGYIKIVKKIKGIPLYNGILKKLSIRNLNPIKIIYSFLIAIIGSNFEALIAGKSEARIEINIEKKLIKIIMSNSIFDGILLKK